jgi:hypothetical protein
MLKKSLIVFRKIFHMQVGIFYWSCPGILFSSSSFFIFRGLIFLSDMLGGLDCICWEAWVLFWCCSGWACHQWWGNVLHVRDKSWNVTTTMKSCLVLVTRKCKSFNNFCYYFSYENVWIMGVFKWAIYFIPVFSSYDIFCSNPYHLSACYYWSSVPL